MPSHAAANRCRRSRSCRWARSARRGDTRSGRGSAGGRVGTSRGSGAMGPPARTWRSARRRAGPRSPRGSPRSRPSSGRPRPTVTSGRSRSVAKAAIASSPNSPPVIGFFLGRVPAVAADIDRQAVEPGGVEELRRRQRPVARRLPAVDEHDARAGAPPRAGMNHAGRSSPPERTVVVLVRQPASVGHHRGRLPARDSRPARGRPARTDRRARPGRRRVPRATRRVGRTPCRRGRHDRRTCQAPVHSTRGEARSARGPRRRSRRLRDRDQGRLAPARPRPPPRPDRRRPGGLACRDAPDGRDQRRLCRAHPRRRPGAGARPRRRRRRLRRRTPPEARRPAGPEADAPGHRPRRHERTPSGRATRPAGHGARRPALPGQPPLAAESSGGEPPRASTPTGPLVKDRVRHFRRRPPPRSRRRTSSRVRQVPRPHVRPDRGVRAVLHRLARRDRTRDPDLVAAARVVQADLDRRGVLRRARPAPEPCGRPPAERSPDREKPPDIGGLSDR